MGRRIKIKPNQALQAALGVAGAVLPVNIPPNSAQGAFHNLVHSDASAEAPATRVFVKGGPLTGDSQAQSRHAHGSLSCGRLL
ncbi:hypothetical protein GJ744_012268 [Endocarpon pusillum]|uniref:Uncharacterized protein n=1 Tax=Endocarpon pusillum TaxID=364733 RepID=A0A8H7AE44_9EURO|nr:hypothetical protein GJ744_012268 [Endocarpon pusillum]